MSLLNPATPFSGACHLSPLLRARTLRLQNKDHHEAGMDMNYKGEFLDDDFVEGSHRFLINDEDSPSERTHNVSQ
jgi:hypothetical protein